MAGGVKGSPGQKVFAEQLVKFGGRSQGKSMLQGLVNEALNKGKKLNALYDIETAGRVAGMSPLSTLRSQEAVDRVRTATTIPPRITVDESIGLNDPWKHMMAGLGDSKSSYSAWGAERKLLHDYSDAELVMEMIRRGYAAMKLPGDGGPPEVLR